jgi:hypothetical protein
VNFQVIVYVSTHFQNIIKMGRFSILKEKVTEAESLSNTFNDFTVKALKQQTVAYSILKALICLLIALMTLYLHIVFRLYTMPGVYYHNCTSTIHDLSTFDISTQITVLIQITLIIRDKWFQSTIFSYHWLCHWI